MDHQPVPGAGHARACTFERVAHGEAAFRAKYGVGPRHLFAMLVCIHRGIGS
jgi:hypothetical protein